MADAARKRVLLIDTTPKMAAGWRHRIQDLSDRWEIEVATGREQAEEILGRGGVDLVAAALDLPGGGAAFLDAATERQPGLVGIVLIDDLAEEQGAGVADLPYHAVPKSCHPEDLNDVMLRAQALASLLGDARLKKSIAQIRSLPTLPELYRELMAELRKEEPSLDRVGEIVSRDLGMTAKMLKLINSALFALPREVTTPAEAVVFLGVETVKALALSLQVFSQFKFVSTLSVEALWNHSWVTGVLAKRIALSVHAPKAVADQSFISGLLHDVGKL
ncbi:MAG TPA: HDOD domain-containing protein, partial [Methylomirabilota bacterium]|nr:HDOD domain-containing protein [Methylomirabilota bacterium]